MSSRIHSALCVQLRRLHAVRSRSKVEFPAQRCMLKRNLVSSRNIFLADVLVQDSLFCTCCVHRKIMSHTKPVAFYYDVQDCDVFTNKLCVCLARTAVASGR